MTTVARRRVPVEGDLTISTATEQKQRLLAALDGAGTVQLDLSGVSELDTAGLQVLLLFQREAAAQNVTVELRDPSLAVTEVLEVLHLNLLEV